MVKRVRGLYKRICTIENVDSADENAQKNKSSRAIDIHNKHKETDNKRLLERLENHEFRTSDYKTFKIYEPKERIIFKLPYYPDRIAQWAVMNVMEDVWVNIFIKHTYSCIKGRGIHKLADDLKRELADDVEGTRYCLKVDIRKFYPSVNHDDLKRVIRRKVKDEELLIMLDEVIDSTDGVPIGNYLSQYFANLYLTYFDHWMLEEVKVKHYFRYADDIVVLSDSKDFLHKVLILMKMYLHHVLHLELKPNYQVYPVEGRGIDYVGYVFFHDHVLLRKSMKLRIFKLLKKYKENKADIKELKARLTSYIGWLKYCNSKNLLRKIERETGLCYSNWRGERVGVTRFYGKKVKIYEVVKHNKRFEIHFVYRHKSYTASSQSIRLYTFLAMTVKKNKYPIIFKMRLL